MIQYWDIFISEPWDRPKAMSQRLLRDKQKEVPYLCTSCLICQVRFCMVTMFRIKTWSKMRRTPEKYYNKWFILFVKLHQRFNKIVCGQYLIIRACCRLYSTNSVFSVFACHSGRISQPRFESKQENDFQHNHRLIHIFFSITCSRPKWKLVMPYKCSTNK